MRIGFKKTCLVILFSIIIIDIFKITGYTTEKKSKENNKEQSQQLVLKLNNDRIVLTADLDSERREYNNFKLKIGDNEKNFNWKSLGSPNFPPTMHLIDLGSDKSAGIAIFLVESMGTGVFIKNIHVIKIDNFKEITVESPLDIVQKHVKAQALNDSIVIEIDGNKTVLDKNYFNKLGISNQAQRLAYEYRIVYGARNNNLYVEVGISNENLTYIGNIHIDYIYKDEMMVMNKMVFQKLN